MAHDSSRRWLVAGAFASTALGACASAPTPALPASEYRPVPRSTLVSRSDPAFVQARLSDGAQRMTVLARRNPAGEPVPVAVVRSVGDGAKALVSAQLIPNGADPALEVLAREQLYALMLRHDAQGHFCLTTGARPCDAADHSVSHDELLRELAAERRRAASQTVLPFATVPWGSVSMSAAALAASDPDDVAVRVAGDSGPMAGVTVYFNRAPHSSCGAKTGVDGVAACRLVDQHGDEGAHEDEDAYSQVIVTYPGDVRPDRVLLPTTFVLPAGGG